MKTYTMVLVALVLGLGSSLAHAELPPGDLEMRRINSREPRPGQIIRVALRYFRVHPERLDALRSNANLRGLLPVISGFAAFDNYQTLQKGSQAGVGTNTNEQNTGNLGTGFTAGASWDLREIVFNPAEVQLYGLIGIQKDIMLEIIRAYYFRRQMQIRLAYKPPQDPIVRMTLELLAEQFGAVIDAMTGGWFNKNVSDEPKTNAAFADSD